VARSPLSAPAAPILRRLNPCGRAADPPRGSSRR
jgi:hypothetical protein